MKTIALTPGCPAGIGPEIFPKSLSKTKVKSDTHFIWCGSIALFEKHAKVWDIKVNRQQKDFYIEGDFDQIHLTATLDDRNDPALEVKPGKPNEAALLSQKNALLTAIDLAKEKKINAIVTGPIRKTALLDINGKSFSGQTELLHYYLPLDDDLPLMCFAGYDFLLGLATIHVPLKEVSQTLSASRLRNCLVRLQYAAAHSFSLNFHEVRLSVLGLNPHAGEYGLIGDEEETTIKPVIAEFKKSGYNMTGPFAADGFFSHVLKQDKNQKPHAVLAMYHDQGLIPYKLLGYDKVTNVTVGLTIPRTSPAHGTADDIAGRYIASTNSLTTAIEQAENLCKQAIFCHLQKRA